MCINSKPMHFRKNKNKTNWFRYMYFFFLFKIWTDNKFQIKAQHSCYNEVMCGPSDVYSLFFFTEVLKLYGKCKLKQPFREIEIFRWATCVNSLKPKSNNKYWLLDFSSSRQEVQCVQIISCWKILFAFRDKLDLGWLI